MFCNLNGNIINEKNATITVNNRSFRYGDGCFETIKIVDGKIILANYHTERLFNSLQILQFELPSFFTPNFILNAILELAKKNQHEKSARIRLTIFRGNGGLYDAENHFPNYLIQSWPLNTENNKLNENGLIVGIFEGGFKAADTFANIKSNNYLLYSQAALYAKQQHWNDALILNHRGTIADATIANIFLIKENTIITPPLADGCVAGTVRRYLLESLPTLGFIVKENSITKTDLCRADAVFLTNAIYNIRWVAEIEGHLLNLGPIAELHQLLIQNF